MKNKETMRCVCGKDITNVHYKKKNAKHQLCICCYQKLALSAKYKRVLLGTLCLCGQPVSDIPSRRRRGLCLSCYSFLYRRIRHMEKFSTDRIMSEEGKKCFCGRDAQWHKACKGCIDRTKESAEIIQRRKDLHSHQGTCLCGNPTRVVRGLCKQCHAYVGYRSRKAKSPKSARKPKLCLCGKKATARGLCNSCYRRIHYWNVCRKKKKEKKDEYK